MSAIIKKKSRQCNLCRLFSFLSWNYLRWFLVLASANSNQQFPELHYGSPVTFCGIQKLRGYSHPVYLWNGLPRPKWQGASTSGWDNSILLSKSPIRTPSLSCEGWSLPYHIIPRESFERFTRQQERLRKHVFWRQEFAPVHATRTYLVFCLFERLYRLPSTL